MRKINNIAWTEQENSLLLEYYYTMSLSVLSGVLPGRSHKDIAKQVAHLKRKNNSFNTPKRF